MKVGLIGYPSSGKSTLYRAAAQGLPKGSVASVPVPDERFDAIVRQVRPKKITPATVELHDDIEAVSAASGRAFSQRFLDSARKMELLLHVARAFDSELAPSERPISPMRDQAAIQEELILADLQLVENRLERLAKSPTAKTPGSADYLERALFERLRAELEAGRPIRSAELGEDEAVIARNYQLLSAKHLVVAVNVSEDQAASPSAEVQAFVAGAAAAGTPAFAVCAKLEEELGQLDPADQPEFLRSMGISEPASAKLIRAVYEALGLITFFTAGENETRAWPLRRGSTALKAASTIHTDIARGFIRAEVVSYEDYSAAGSLDAANSTGRMRLEGREYVVKDGDLLHIRNKS